MTRMIPPRKPSPPQARSLAEEIDLLRSLLISVREQMDCADTLKETLAVADSLGKLSARIAALLRADQGLAVKEQGAYNANHVLQELVEKLKLEEEEEKRNAGRIAT